jgi:hypothetical protein
MKINLFVMIILSLDFGAGFWYFLQKDFARGFYWLSAMAITTTTIFIK